MTTPTAPLATDRADLIRRLFAVSLSVGFASQVAKMSWLIDGKLPTGGDIQDIVLLIISGIVVVLSWDGYLGAIRDFPLQDASRFYLDVVIVFLYLVLLECSHINNIWFWISAIDAIFVLYIIWDLLTKLNHPNYVGLLPTTAWCAYFITISFIAFFGKYTHLRSMLYLMLLGIIVYRIDKSGGLSNRVRITAIAAPIIFLIIKASFLR
jgi:hypothetical protein